MFTIPIEDTDAAVVPVDQFPNRVTCYLLEPGEIDIDAYNQMVADFISAGWVDSEGNAVVPQGQTNTAGIPLESFGQIGSSATGWTNAQMLSHSGNTATLAGNWTDQSFELQMMPGHQIQIPSGGASVTITSVFFDGTNTVIQFTPSVSTSGPGTVRRVAGWPLPDVLPDGTMFFEYGGDLGNLRNLLKMMGNPATDSGDCFQNDVTGGLSWIKPDKLYQSRMHFTLECGNDPDGIAEGDYLLWESYPGGRPSGWSGNRQPELALYVLNGRFMLGHRGSSLANPTMFTLGQSSTNDNLIDLGPATCGPHTFAIQFKLNWDVNNGAEAITRVWMDAAEDQFGIPIGPPTYESFQENMTNWAPNTINNVPGHQINFGRYLKGDTTETVTTSLVDLECLEP